MSLSTHGQIREIHRAGRKFVFTNNSGMVEDRILIVYAFITEEGFGITEQGFDVYAG